MAYSKEQEARLIELGTIEFADLETVAAELKQSPRSIIAKVQSLQARGEDVRYVPKPTEPKRPRGMTKARLVAEIAESVGIEGDVVLAGLAKATSQALEALRVAVATD